MHRCKNTCVMQGFVMHNNETNRIKFNSKLTQKHDKTLKKGGCLFMNDMNATRYWFKHANVFSITLNTFGYVSVPNMIQL